MNTQIANGMVLCEHYLSVQKCGTELQSCSPVFCMYL